MGEEMTYTCAACGGTFELARPDDEARAEAHALFGSQTEGPMSVVCEDCWRVMAARYGWSIDSHE